MPHSVVKQADNYRVRELVKKIENHPHQQSHQRDLQPNKAYKPLSEKSKKMIMDIGNVELFNLFETEPNTQCKECLLFWSPGIIYCTCGHLLTESEAIRGAIQCTFDLISIPNYVITKGQHHGHRYGKTTAQREHYVAHNLRKRCFKKHFQGIHHHFVNDPEFRASQLEHDRDEEVCIKMDELAQKDFRHQKTQPEYFRYRKNWWISLNNEITSARLEKSSRPQRGVAHITPSTPRIWKTTTQANAILEVSILTPIIEFFLQLVAMERFLVDLKIIQMKVRT